MIMKKYRVHLRQRIDDPRFPYGRLDDKYEIIEATSAKDARRTGKRMAAELNNGYFIDITRI
jgi:hypothetical protein